MDAELRVRLRAHVVQEILQTEQSYVADLHILTDLFFVPLRDRIAPADHVKVFSNIEILLGLHEQLSTALHTQEALEPSAHTIGAIFLKFV
jgi:RhoGEF domain